MPRYQKIFVGQEKWSGQCPTFIYLNIRLFLQIKIINLKHKLDVILLLNYKCWKRLTSTRGCHCEHLHHLYKQGKKKATRELSCNNMGKMRENFVFESSSSCDSNWFCFKFTDLTCCGIVNSSIVVDSI